MSDQGAKKGSSGKEGDWDFKLDNADLNEGRATAPVSKTGVHRLMNKRVKNETLGLNTKDLPKTVSRSNTEHYINNNASKRKQVVVTHAQLGQRLTGAAVDVVVGLILVQVARMYSDFTFSHVATLATQYNLKEHLDFPYLYHAIVALNFIPLYLLCFFVPAWLKCKTPGKFVAKTSIDDIDGGDLGMMRTLMRECIYKPLSIISVVGLLMFLFQKEKRALHDFMALSIVRREA